MDNFTPVTERSRVIRPLPDKRLALRPKPSHIRRQSRRKDIRQSGKLAKTKKTLTERKTLLHDMKATERKEILEHMVHCIEKLQKLHKTLKTSK
jgi:hypothetical protein